MPIISYLAYPVSGKSQELQHQLFQFPECEVIPAENQDVLVVVTETANAQEEKYLQAKMEQLSTLQWLVMVSGFVTPSNQKEH